MKFYAQHFEMLSSVQDRLTYKCYYNEPVVFKSKISVGKMTGGKTRPTDPINICYVCRNIDNFSSALQERHSACKACSSSSQSFSFGSFLWSWLRSSNWRRTPGGSSSNSSSSRPNLRIYLMVCFQVMCMCVKYKNDNVFPSIGGSGAAIPAQVWQWLENACVCVCECDTVFRRQWQVVQAPYLHSPIHSYWWHLINMPLRPPASYLRRWVVHGRSVHSTWK